MSAPREQGAAVLMEVSNAMVRLHKEQFGRGPTSARSSFAGPDSLLCVLEDVLLPAELKLVEMGMHERVRDSRTSFQVATAAAFTDAVEQIVERKVRAFASAVDPDANTVFEVFQFERAESSLDGRGDLPAGVVAPLGPRGSWEE
jgi:uncharacterized protein YbcI